MASIRRHLPLLSSLLLELLLSVKGAAVATTTCFATRNVAITLLFTGLLLNQDSLLFGQEFGLELVGEFYLLV